MSGGDACSEAPSPVSSTILDESHNVRSLDVPSLTSFHNKHLAVRPDKTYQNFC
jgi:hypothetical protein